MKHLDLFSGIGGFAYAADQVWSGVEHIFCDIEPFSQKLIARHWPGSRMYGDIRDIKGEGKVDLLTGGFPCQPFPVQGKDEVRRTTAISGRKCLELYDLQNRNGSSLRTCVALLLGTTEWYSSRRALIWSSSVMPSNRLLFQLLPLTRFTDETGYGLLPTMRASEGKKDQFRLESIQRVNRRHKENGLTFGFAASEAILLNLEKKMNLSFAEWMMGYPIGWTDLKGSETPSSPK